MQSRRLVSALIVALGFFGGDSSALEFDFVLHSTNKSYLTSLTNQTEKDYLREYLSVYGRNQTTHYSHWANTFAVAGANLPVFGKPHMESCGGLSLGYGEQLDVDWNEVGLRTLDYEGQGMFDMSLFYTFSLDRGPADATSVGGVPRSRLRRFLSDTDLTLKYNNLMIAVTDVRMNFSNIGAVLRKQIVAGRPVVSRYVSLSGVSLSLGALYSGFAGREDDIYTSFENEVPEHGEPSEVLVVDTGSAGTVSVNAPLDPDIRSFVYYPYIEFRNLLLHSGATGYVNLFSALDLFLGANVAVAPISTIYGDVHADVNVKITDNSGLETSHDGRLTTIGATDGDWFLPMFVFGGQLNLGPVKIPLQVSTCSRAKARAVNAGLHVSL